MHVSDPLAKLVHQTAHHSRWESVMNDGESSNQIENTCHRHTQCSLPLPLLARSPSYTAMEVKCGGFQSISSIALCLRTDYKCTHKVRSNEWEHVKGANGFYHGVFMFFHENSFLAGTQTNVYHMTNTRQSILATVPCFASHLTTSSFLYLSRPHTHIACSHIEPRRESL